MINYTSKFAIDAKSVRSYDEDGRLHVATTNISKANVCPYLGREIPDGDKLGLDPDKVYHLYRHPDELAKAARSFNGIQLLRKHIPVSIDDHNPYDVIGSTGNEAKFNYPYLTNSIVVWPKGDIDDIESEQKKELSSAYRYRADMTPGVVEGVKYDGVMRDIVGNHVALVEEGRAGNDVVVGDAKLQQIKEPTMATRILTRKAAMLAGAIEGFMRPRLAADAKLDYGKLLGSVTTKNFAKKKGAIIAGLKDQTKGKLAKDASVEGLVELLDGLEKLDGADADAEEMQTEPSAGIPAMLPEKEDKSSDADQDVDVHAALRAVLEGAGVPEEVIEQACAAVGGEGDAELEDPIPKEKLGGFGAAEKGEDEEKEHGEDEVDEHDAGKFAGSKDKAGGAKDKAAKDEPPPFKGKPEVGKGPPMSGDQINKAIAKAVAQANQAADAKIKAAVKQAQDNGARIREAERFVRPWVGDLAMAHDSAEDVYRTALTAVGVDVTDVHPSAFKVILERTPKPDTSRPFEHNNGSMAADSASLKGFSERFPTAPKDIKFA